MMCFSELFMIQAVSMLNNQAAKGKLQLLETYACLHCGHSKQVPDLV